MTAWLNYIIEANIGLLVLLAAYKLLFSNETNFRLVRLMLLGGVIAVLIFPLFHLEAANVAPSLSISSVVPSFWLPQMVIGEEVAPQPAHPAADIWTYASAIYIAGLILFFALVAIQLIRLVRVIKRARTYRFQGLHIAESTESELVFSFFFFIFIGRAHQLSTEDKRQIILHESVHAKQWHSLDILLVYLVKIVFWFNPAVNAYKKIFIQLHEFEADARAVENSDVNKYCSLLAKVALQSAGFKLANHFSNSLTIKRIEMMRTMKTKMHSWKITVMALVMAVAFVAFACQDQVGGTDADSNDLTLSVDEHAYPEGGFESFYKQVKMNLRYPASARRDHKYGTVRVRFVVNKDGRLSDLEVLDSPDPVLGEEVVSALSLVPKWVPARRSGASVKEQMVFPVTFKLDLPGKGTEGQANAPEIIPDLLSLNEIVVVGYAN